LIYRHFRATKNEKSEIFLISISKENIFSKKTKIFGLPIDKPEKM